MLIFDFIRQVGFSDVVFIASAPLSFCFLLPSFPTFLSSEVSHINDLIVSSSFLMLAKERKKVLQAIQFS